VPPSALGEQPRQFEYEPGLSGPAGADHGQHAGIAIVDERHRGRELVLAADEPCRGLGELDAARRPQRRKDIVAELIQADRTIEILEPMPSEVPKRHAVEQRGRRRRDDGLPTVRERRDPSTAMDVEADVPVTGDRRGARV